MTEVALHPRLVRSIVFAAILLGASILQAANWKIIGWNNLGMHCMDDDYSVLSILPPYNTVDAQLIDSTGHLVTTLPTGLSVSYEAVADPDGSINQSSIGKSNFWDYSLILFGVALPAETGLAGNMMPGLSNLPRPMSWASTGAPSNSFEALGVPITPIDDRGRTNTYPMLKLVARDAANNVLAQTNVVLPVSTELNCSSCHASGIGQPAAMPSPTWVYDPNPKRDFRLNALKLHDQKYLTSPAYVAALAQFNYRNTGLYDTVVMDGRPILCATCHRSEALGTAGAPNTPQLTTSMHSKHATVIDPNSGLNLDDSANRTSCYLCHPGSTTRCLRGAMGAAVSTVDGSMLMQCQSCHGSMSNVGSATRTGWFEEPNCQSCHTGDALSNSGQIRYSTAFDSPGHMRVPPNNRFATNPDTPATGISLYRFSYGHGGLQCSACHGSTHAELPSAYRNDNLQSWTLQGHVGKLAECTACHPSMPNTISGGPHGMHPTDQTWVTNHHDLIGGNLTQCRVCHGTDYRGTVLSRAQGDRDLSFKGTPKHFWRGQKVSCYDCHDGIDTDGRTRKIAPAVPPSSSLAVSGTSASITLGASGTGSTLRIVQQPAHGTVALSGNIATYFAEPGFSGPDYFTYAAMEATGFVESNLGVVSVSVGDAAPNLLNYALGLSLSSGTYPTTLPSVTIESNYLTMTVVRSIPPPDVTLTGQASGDLGMWDSTSVVTLTNIPALLKLRDSQTTLAAPHRFLRLQVSRP